MIAPTKQALLSLANELRSGNLPLEKYLDGLEVIFNDQEPSVRAFVEEDDRFGRLQREAAELVRRYPQPLHRPPLFGLPVGVKDIFHVDGFQTQAGSLLPVEVLQGSEAASVTVLKEAGALIMGKTVTTEFAYFSPGPTRNPRNLKHTPGGSSSGSAAAVAAGLSPLAIGTQTIGSIVRPAAFCGVVGYKPSYDRVSREGVIPLSPSLDHIGTFSTDVAGVELTASVLCPDWHLALVEDLPTLGVPVGPYLDQASTTALDHFEATYALLAESGCTVKKVEAMPDFASIVKRHNLIVAAEAAMVHALWYDEYGELYHEKTAALIERGREISTDELLEALEGRRQLTNQLSMLMDEHDLDLWISPSAPGAAPTGLDSTGDPVMNLPWTHSGLPSVNIPSGQDGQGLPLGLQVAGRWYEDEALLAWSIQLEPVLQSE